MTTKQETCSPRRSIANGESMRSEIRDRILRGFHENEIQKNIPEKLFRKHLGLPVEVAVEESVAQIEEMVRCWYARYACPWSSVGVNMIRKISDDQVVLDNGVILKSERLAQGFLEVNANAVIVAGLSAGVEVDAEIERLWRVEKPDEAMFLNALAIASVEYLRSQIWKHFSDRLANLELAVLPHYSPGYEGWDLEDQSELLRCLDDSGPIISLASGSLNPSKSTLANFGVAPRQSWWSDRRGSFWDRSSFKGTKRTPVASDQFRKSYAFPERALEKWSRSRLSLDSSTKERIRATFRLDGTTCSGMGIPLAFDYIVDLHKVRDERYLIDNLKCEFAEGDKGHRSTCLFLSNLTDFQIALKDTPPLQGWSLDEVLEWDPGTSPSGCVCTHGSRGHKWRMVLQTLHYALCQRFRYR